MKYEMKKWYSAELVDQVIDELVEELENEMSELTKGEDICNLAYKQGKLDALKGKKDSKAREEIKDNFYTLEGVPSYMDIKDVSRNFGAGMKDAKTELSNILSNRA